MEWQICSLRLRRRAFMSGVLDPQHEGDAAADESEIDTQQHVLDGRFGFAPSGWRLRDGYHCITPLERKRHRQPLLAAVRESQAPETVVETVGDKKEEAGMERTSERHLKLVASQMLSAQLQFIRIPIPPKFPTSDDCLFHSG